MREDTRRKHHRVAHDGIRRRSIKLLKYLKTMERSYMWKVILCMGNLASICVIKRRESGRRRKNATIQTHKLFFPPKQQQEKNKKKKEEWCVRQGFGWEGSRKNMLPIIISIVNKLIFNYCLMNDNSNDTQKAKSGAREREATTATTSSQSSSNKWNSFLIIEKVLARNSKFIL